MPILVVVNKSMEGVEEENMTNKYVKRVKKKEDMFVTLCYLWIQLLELRKLDRPFFVCDIYGFYWELYLKGY